MHHQPEVLVGVVLDPIYVGARVELGCVEAVTMEGKGGCFLGELKVVVHSEKMNQVQEMIAKQATRREGYRLAEPRASFGLDVVVHCASPECRRVVWRSLVPLYDSLRNAEGI